MNYLQNKNIRICVNYIFIEVKLYNAKICWKKSKKMADLRTGTLAVSAALNIAGATVSGVNMKKNTTITERISNCLNTTQELANTLLQLQINVLMI